MANVMFKSGSLAQYNASSKDIHVFYLVDDKDLYIGAHKITNEDDLANAVGRLEAAEGTIGTHSTDIAKLKEDLAKLTGSAEGSITDLLSALETTLTTKINNVQGGVDENAQAILDEKGRAEAAESALSERIDSADSEISGLKTTVGGHTATIGQHTTDIGNLQASVGELSDADGAMDKRVTAVEGKVTKLVGADTDKSVRDIAAEETAKIVAGADEKYDTLVEIADWIKSDTTGAAKMANDIADHETRLVAAEGELDNLEPRVAQNEKDIAQLKTDVDAVEVTVGQHETKIAALEKADDDNLQAAKEHTNTEVGKVNQALTQGLADASAARATLEQLIGTNAGNIATNTAAIAEINNNTTGILATAKAYSDANLATAKGYTDEKLTWQALA